MSDIIALKSKCLLTSPSIYILCELCYFSLLVSIIPLNDSPIIYLNTLSLIILFIAKLLLKPSPFSSKYTTFLTSYLILRYFLLLIKFFFRSMILFYMALLIRFFFLRLWDGISNFLNIDWNLLFLCKKSILIHPLASFWTLR